MHSQSSQRHFFGLFHTFGPVTKSVRNIIPMISNNDNMPYFDEQGSTLRKNFISPAGLVTETFTNPEIFLLALILMTTLFKY